MKIQITQYIQEQLVRAQDRLRANTVSSVGIVYPERHIFITLKKKIHDFYANVSQERWVVIPGLRGVGKTTVVSQLYFYIVQEMKVAQNRVLYVSLDEVEDLGGSLQDVLASYEYILGQSYESQQEPLFLLLDEVQVDTRWAKTLKTLYERSHTVFVLCTGSSAVELQSTADAERRAIFHKMFPMSFSEYQMIKNQVYPENGLQQSLINAVYYANSVQEAHQQLSVLDQQIQKYWSMIDQFDIQEYFSIGTLPFAIGRTNEYQVYQAILRLLDQVIMKDIQSMSNFEYETTLKIKSLLYLLADSNDVLSFSTIGNTIGLLRLTLNDIFEALEKTELLIRAYPHGSNTGRATKPSKFVFMSPAIRQALTIISGKKATNETARGHLLEDVVGLHVYREFVTQHKGSLTYDASEGGADFILELHNQRQIVIEVGMNKKDSKQVQKTMNKIGSDYGMVISQQELNVDAEKNMLFLPLKVFLLM
ncbi:MAG: ATP-binding protein [Candidatus Kerfeldbacteria bacterium]|nr:ATP-binding protein [Candidatus Kerfeldbacteria bacterium]